MVRHRRRGAARVFHSKIAAHLDGVVTRSAMTALQPTSSLAFADARNSIAVGGDVERQGGSPNLAVTSTAAQPGRAWRGPKGFRSAVAWLPEQAVDYHRDLRLDVSSGGATWKMFDDGSPRHEFYRAGWAVGGRDGRGLSPWSDDSRCPFNQDFPAFTGEEKRYSSSGRRVQEPRLRPNSALARPP